MRTIKECTAEVFLRSEKKIRQRRQNRRRVLLSIIPLVLCVGGLVTVFGPQSADKSTGDLIQENANSNMAGLVEWEGINGNAADGNGGTTDEMYAGDSPKDGFVQLKIQSAQGTVTREENVQELYNQLQLTMLESVRNNGDTPMDPTESIPPLPPPAAGNDTDVDSAQNPSDRYVITFTTELGSEEVYTLSENVLTEDAAGYGTKLDDAQVAWLMEMFGLE